VLTQMKFAFILLNFGYRNLLFKRILSQCSNSILKVHFCIAAPSVSKIFKELFSSPDVLTLVRISYFTNASYIYYNT